MCALSAAVLTDSNTGLSPHPTVRTGEPVATHGTRKYRSPTQRSVMRFAVYDWAIWSVAWFILGWRVGGPGGLFIGWAMANALPYTTWARWRERALVKDSLKRMGMLS